MGKTILLFVICAALSACATPAAGKTTSLISREEISKDITPFYKWTGVLARLDTEPEVLWPEEKTGSGNLKDLPLRLKAESVNEAVNTYAYLDDEDNWGKPDYWQTPVEFLSRGGGDCEDFAIAKYEWLRELGVPEDQMRIAVVYDNYQHMTHTVLTVHTDQKEPPLVLDNQTTEILDGLGDHYLPLFSINRHAWWRHTA
jgi:predicted transglutaminase-like cysteine proteinase